MSWDIPFERDSEIYLIGLAIAVKTAIDDMQDITPEMFYDPANRLLMKAALSVKRDSGAVDIITVTKWLRDCGKLTTDLMDYMLKCTRTVGSDANIRQHKAIIKEAHVRRSLIDLGVEVSRSMYDRSVDIGKALGDVSEAIANANSTLSGGQVVDTATALEMVVKNIEDISHGRKSVSGITTGSPKLDQITGGWQDTDLIVLAGRPGMAKTTRALSFAYAAAASGKSAAIFSLEMSSQQLLLKYINNESCITMNKLKEGKLNQVQLDLLRNASKKVAAMSITIDDKSAVTPQYIRSRCHQIKKEMGLDLVLIDYIQLCRSSTRKDTRDAEVGSITQDLKMMAKDFKIPVIALSQLSRKTEERTDKRPILSDLRESGSIEQDADMVLGLYRPSYYHELEKDRDYNGEVTDPEEYRRISELHVLKHRNGAANVFVGEYFYGEFSRFGFEYVNPYGHEYAPPSPGTPF